jgi:hypothetical protein
MQVDVEPPMPQPPQFCGSVAGSTQRPPQHSPPPPAGPNAQACPSAAPAQEDAMQTIPLHALPGGHPVGSPEHSKKPPSGPLHEPSTQLPPAGQTVPHPPQSVMLVFWSTHESPQQAPTPPSPGKTHCVFIAAPEQWRTGQNP